MPAKVPAKVVNGRRVLNGTRTLLTLLTLLSTLGFAIRATEPSIHTALFSTGRRLDSSAPPTVVKDLART